MLEFAFRGLSFANKPLSVVARINIAHVTIVMMQGLKEEHKSEIESNIHTLDPE
jgi:hypothetical protein